MSKDKVVVTVRESVNPPSPVEIRSVNPPTTPSPDRGGSVNPPSSPSRGPSTPPKPR
ncbi:hypothetical protein [Curvivirga sp.]|uniref:hypothetical protein n=1 Tax=Curvivirga sp. TaxID=2856848 RepID=UPI003B595B9A